ncbi:UbiX family flavin prenyltransferase [Candidatus Erwinia haradaeae]|uniref:Flavin prenyltransferase UbiX n=1 Tax=Candidatus Erwinia haradaeae TaxID=1922217 RepID=A0A451D253_9GAMM|nr:UbiX family flavin prenyltransferase [Candidatus Erwinia haradaeae]VFP79691.1 Flavin prenyltransferase UbiX [Candidatus Erwinia haradaeae]
MKRFILGISGASGVIYGIRTLQVLQKVKNIETHLIISQAACQTLLIESNYSIRDVQAMANVVHDVKDISATISSGSFKTIGMAIVPCSIKTLSGVVHGYNDGLMIRAADVVLKERRRLVLCVRESPLHLGHLRMMTTAAEIGAIIMPLVSAFYHHPYNIMDIIDQIVNRMLDQFDIELNNDLFRRWEGVSFN